jgi:hypothetical protein
MICLEIAIGNDSPLHLSDPLLDGRYIDDAFRMGDKNPNKPPKKKKKKKKKVAEEPPVKKKRKKPRHNRSVTG